MNVLKNLIFFIGLLLIGGCQSNGQKISTSVVTVCVKNDFIKMPVNSSMWFSKPAQSVIDSCYRFNYKYPGNNQVVTFFYGKGRKWSQLVADGDSILVDFDASRFYNFGESISTQGGRFVFNNKFIKISLSANSINSSIFNPDAENNPRKIIEERDRLLEELVVLGEETGVDKHIINSLALEIEANVYLKLKKNDWNVEKIDSLNNEIDSKIKLSVESEIGFPDVINIYWVDNFNRRCNNVGTKADCYQKNGFEKFSPESYTTFRYLLASEGRTPEIEKIIKTDIQHLPESMSYLATKLMDEYDKTPKSYDLEAYNLQGESGQKISFKDLSHDLVYVDFWATWCVPCRAEHPEWNKLEQAYQGQISFLGVSLDKKSSLDKWLQVIESSRLAGTQVIVNNAFDSYLPRLLNVRAIPRYAVFDRNGQVLVSSAPRPGQKEAKILFDSLLSK